MNLYTKIWLKLAPKGWQGVSDTYLNIQREQFRDLKVQRDALYDIVQSLRQGYNQLAALVTATTKEVQVW